MTAHDHLKANGITPTIDAERAYQLGYATAIGRYASAISEQLTEADPQHKPANAGKTTSEPAKRRYN
jgi:hypothetical protein